MTPSWGGIPFSVWRGIPCSQTAAEEAAIAGQVVHKRRVRPKVTRKEENGHCCQQQNWAKKEKSRTEWVCVPVTLLKKIFLQFCGVPERQDILKCTPPPQSSLSSVYSLSLHFQKAVLRVFLDIFQCIVHHAVDFGAWFHPATFGLCSRWHFKATAFVSSSRRCLFRFEIERQSRVCSVIAKCDAASKRHYRKSGPKQRGDASGPAWTRLQDAKCRGKSI